jgi:hypothetical protein
MGFKKEVRAFMAERNAEKGLVIQLQKQNQDLMDRLMASNFGELKTYAPNPEWKEPEKEEYDPTKDETTAGLMVE